ncbi:MAG: hypothetical protein BWX71_00779 [Deltaproteobacteria bacterium ADurb.Bin072]|nr:MAG: hypothetical protein BWX71_00779 [Deltaproteobacteria bacterium ADurb.Bin072]
MRQYRSLPWWRAPKCRRHQWVNAMQTAPKARTDLLNLQPKAMENRYAAYG